MTKEQFEKKINELFAGEYTHGFVNGYIHCLRDLGKISSERCDELFNKIVNREMVECQ